VELVHVLLLEEIIEFIIMDPTQRWKSLHELGNVFVNEIVHVVADELVITHH